jgi:hypothetical protein
MPDPQPNPEPSGTAAGPVPAAPEPSAYDHLDEQEVESFPASDPHSDWAGPGN